MHDDPLSGHIKQGILLGMKLPRISFERLVAMGLPLCFAWTFVACVTLCSEHIRNAQDAHATGSAAEMRGLDESDCCPITTSATSLLPERITPIKQLGADQQATAARSMQCLIEASRGNGYARLPASSSDPPLMRLGVLRI
jgi:hypothetical protein